MERIIQVITGCVISALGIWLFVSSLLDFNALSFFFGLVLAGTGAAVICYWDKKPRETLPAERPAQEIKKK